MKDTNSKKNIIEGIKYEWLGDENSGNQKALKKAHSRLTDTTKLLSDELYVDDLHFLMELIQNADDNTYSKNEIPTLEIKLQEDKLIFICNEKGFTQKDVEAICDVNASGKISDESERRGYIGEKGIGFKSVFKVCDIPEIYSNGFQFRLFGSNTNQHNLKYVVPEWIDKPTIDIDGKKTTLVLPLKKIYQKGGEKENDLSKEFSQIEPNILLFLRKIEKLIIIDEANNQKTEILKSIDNNIVTLTIKQKNEVTTSQKYLLINHKDRPVPNGLKETRATEKREGIKYSDITLGFPLTPSKKPKILESNKVYTFLPVKDYGLNFLINADFLLTSAREDIIDNDWNRWLRSEVFEAFKIAIKKFKKDTNFKYYFLKYLSDPENINNVFFKELSTNVFNYCKQEAVFPTTIRNKWTTVDKIIGYNVEDILFINKETLEQEVIGYFMSKEAHRNYKDKVCNLFDIQPIRLEQIAKCLDNPEWIEKYNHKKLLEFYQYLQDNFKQNYGLLGNKKIIRLKDKSFKSAKDNSIFLKIPTEGKRRYSFENRLDIVHSDFIKDKSSIQHFFVKIGVKRATAQTIILDYILPQFSENLKKSTIISFTKYIKEHFDKFDGQEITKIKTYIKIITNTGEFREIKEYETFFSSKYAPRYDMEFFLKGLHGNIFLSEEYLKNGESTTEWIKFFKELGVYEFPMPCYKKDGNSDIVSCWQIERILRNEENNKYSLLMDILNEEWNFFEYSIYNKKYTNHFRRKYRKRDSNFIALIKSKNIIQVVDKWYKPSEVYYLSPKITDLFENRLSILNAEQYSNKSFLETFGVKFQVENGKYIELLKDYKKAEEVEISNLREIYTQINSNLKAENLSIDEDVKVRKTFTENALIYKNDKWYKPSEVIWKTPPKVFKDDYTPLAATYKSKIVKSFFVEKLQIKEEIKVDDSYNLLLEFEGKKVDRESRNIIEKLYATINFNDIEDEEERTEKINTLKNSKIWLNQSDKLCSSNELYFVEDRSLYRTFKDEAIYLYNVSISNQSYSTSIKHFFTKLGIYQSFSEALSLKIESFEEQDFNGKWKKKLKIAIRIAIEYINSKEEPKAIEHLSKKMFFKKLSDANVIILEEIQATYSINKISKSSAVDSLFDTSENIIFIKGLEDEIIQSLLAEEIGKYLKVDGLDDFIDRVLSKKNRKRIYKKKNITQLKKEDIAQIILGKRNDISIEEIQDLLGIEEYEEEIQDDTATKKPKSENQTSPKSNNEKITSPNTKPEMETDFSDEDFDEFDDDEEQEFDIPPFSVPIETKDYGKKDDSYSKAVKTTFKDAKRSSSSYSNYRKYQPKTTGDWGEFTIFLSLVGELKEKYSSLSKYEESENLFIIKDTKDEVVIKLELLNLNGKEAASRDIELTENGKLILIEVKSTTDDYLNNFKVTNSQWKAMKKEKDSYWLFRVFGVGKSNCRIEKIVNPYQQIIDGKINITSDLDLGL